MDNALIGVLIGSGLSLLGTLIQNFFSAWKEGRDWKERRLNDEETWKRESTRAERNELREVYQEVHAALSQIATFKQQSKSDEQTTVDAATSTSPFIKIAIFHAFTTNFQEQLTSFTTKTQCQTLQNK